MEVVGMSDICETLKKHETTLPFLTLNLTFGVYGYQIDTITYFSELNLFFILEEEFLWPDTKLAHSLGCCITCCLIQGKAQKIRLIFLYSTNLISLANYFLEREPGFLCTLNLAFRPLTWGSLASPGRQGFWGELTCFTAMLTLTELMEPSIRTFSFSFLLMVTGCSRSSLLLLRTQNDKGLCTIKEQNGQGDSMAGSRITIWDHRVQGIRDSQAGVLQEGRQRACSPAEKAQALESGWKGSETQPPLLLLLGKLPCWNLNFLIWRQIKKGQLYNSGPGTLQELYKW